MSRGFEFKVFLTLGSSALTTYTFLVGATSVTFSFHVLHNSVNNILPQEHAAGLVRIRLVFPKPFVWILAIVSLKAGRVGESYLGILVKVNY